MASARDLLEQWIQTFNESQWEASERLWTHDGTSDEIGTGRTTNVQEGTQNARQWKAAFPDATGRIENLVQSGNKAAAEIIWTGTNSGSMNGMPATGKQVTVRAAAFLTEEGGQIKRVNHYLDIAGMMAQLGVSPAGAAGAR